MASAQQIADATPTHSPLHRIIRYVGKMAANLNDPTWEGDKYVLSVKKNGQLDLDLVKNHFVNVRGIVTEAEFDQAVADAEAEGLINGQNMNISGPKFMSVYNLLEERAAGEAQEAADQSDAQRLFTLSVDEREALRVNYNARVNEILDDLIAA